jgi:ribosomal protein S18 acetylase RimI-like enzyme
METTEYKKTANGFEAINKDGKQIAQVKIRQVRDHIAIDDIGVDRPYRRQGIASTLTDLVINEAKEKGVSSVNALAQPEYANLLSSKGFLLDGFFARLFLGENKE